MKSGIVIKINEEETNMSDFDYGPLAPFMQNEDIHTIYVNDPKHIYIWHMNGYEPANIAFKDAAELAGFAQSLARAVGQTLDANNPIAELRLPNGSHATLMVAPVATQGAVLQISKAVSESFTMEKMIEIGAVSANAAKFLTACVRTRMNIAVVGGFNSGKSTFLNTLVNEVSELARLVVIQPISTLSIHHPDSVILESRKANLDGTGAITNRHLLQHTLELYPHRIVLAELDGTEADVLLNALDLGFSTLFAMSGSSPRDALSRLESAVAATSLSSPLLTIREKLARTLNLIVHVELFELGEIALKRIVGISEVRGMKGDSIELAQLFERPRDRDELLALGEVSQLLDKIRQLGRSEVDEAWFQA
jgi:pilus assembly protein CpaF